MRHLVPVLALALLCFTGCKKYNDYKKAIVVNTGDITSAGCGYMLAVEDGALMKPDNMPSGFTHDSLAVLVKYHSTGAVVCNFFGGNREMETIAIEDIVRQ